MKKLYFLIALLAAGVAFYEQSKQNPNVWVTVTAIIFFMVGVMQMSAKTPSKHQDKNDGDVQ